ncbi:hypothetical protein CONPUDRAFT_159631 [Coniophora puteana RWD-64-598 SS2]|uniref:Fatty acid hydroxylase domain-containing protein n=1 Tax=Coniophora puteana (strain RWD-64-598) TaxID=741705 RepID=A0A5M3M681_CONPW|nr:uncharacterized protein CONPUDRAFT_159631 [Coniophora puteana RWD-64-598 SS2]EIW74859.1 hypothetical protein CONPUDRAFT_159631 [Coniophora puteana RWD-64-598 SS2]
MDLILDTADTYFLDRAWARALPALSTPHSNITATYSVLESAWTRDYIPRQLISLGVLSFVGFHMLYFTFATLSYMFVFNHEMMKHPRFKPNQVKLEIQDSLRALPGVVLLTLPWFQAEVMGYSKLYDHVDEYGWSYFIFSVVFFIAFTDLGVYWAHRTLHRPSLYKRLHKVHHRWLVPTPFSAYAIHPVDVCIQSLPYHIFIFVFPLHRWLYLGLFNFVSLWSILIHDGDMIAGHPLEKYINGPAHHTMHHLYFTVNYGQYFTWADRLGGSYRHPDGNPDSTVKIKKDL